ncbi:MAG: hypothetical protein AAF327_23200 [Cyanobacteria bacterium P01_A01_bin.37]
MAEKKRGRFGSIIKAAKETREPEDQTSDEVNQASKPDSQTARS